MNFITGFGLTYLVGLNTLWFNIWVLENQILTKKLETIEYKINKLELLKTSY